MSISIKQQFHKEMCSVKKCDICADFYFCYSNWLEAHLETHTLPRSEALEKDKVRELKSNPEMYGFKYSTGDDMWYISDKDFGKFRDLLDMVGEK